MKRRSLPKADRAKIEKRYTDEFNLYANQTRYNDKARELSPGVRSCIQSMEVNLALLSSRVSNIKLKLIDISNDWIFGVIEGNYEDTINLNLIINGTTELKLKIPPSGNGITPFTYKLKWFSPRVESISVNIVGLGVSHTFKPSQMANLDDKFIQLCDYFPSAEEHIFSVFLCVLNKSLSKKVYDKASGQKFIKYPRHKMFIDGVLEYINFGNGVKLNDLLNKNPEYKKILSRTKNTNLISFFLGEGV